MTATCNYNCVTVYFCHVICKVKCYINNGWDQYLVHPDIGENCHKKLVSVALTQPQSLSCRLFQSVPPPNDPQWTNQLHKLPKVILRHHI